MLLQQLVYGSVDLILYSFNTNTVTLKLKYGCKPCGSGKLRITYVCIIHSNKWSGDLKSLFLAVRG